MKKGDDIFLALMTALFVAVVVLLGAVAIMQAHLAKERAEAEMNAIHAERVCLSGGVR